MEVWLQTSLVDAVKTSGTLAHRSISQQIEYWANLGRKTESLLTEAEILQVISGVTEIHKSSVNSMELEVESVYKMLEDDRKKELCQKSVCRDGYLDQLHSGGHVVIGSFKKGVFIEL